MVVRFVAYGLAMIAWIVIMLPIWSGAVGTMTIAMALKIMGNVVSGRSTTHGQSELDELAAMWPRGFSDLRDGMFDRHKPGTGPASTRSRISGIFAMVIYSIIFWGGLAAVVYWLTLSR
jgi:hypothetical protein